MFVYLIVLLYIVDESYRTVLRLTWKAKYGDIEYKQVNYWDIMLGSLPVIIWVLVVIERTFPRGNREIFKGLIEHSQL